MAEIIQFPKLKIGSIINIHLNNLKTKVKILESLDNNYYKVKVLSGPMKHEILTFQLITIDGKPL